MATFFSAFAAGFAVFVALTADNHILAAVMWGGAAMNALMAVAPESRP